MILEVQTFFQEERGEEIGKLAAEIYFEYIKDRLGPVFYNYLLHEARSIAGQRMQVLEEDYYALEKQL